MIIYQKFKNLKIVLTMYDTDPNSYISKVILCNCWNGAGTTHLAVHKLTNVSVIIKKFHIDNVVCDEYNLVKQEIIITRQLQHPNILPYLASYVSGHSICVVSPLMDYGSCNDLLNQYFVEGLPELAIAFILKDVLQGLEYIHKRGYIHRAVKASHILISALGQACLSGMRYACEIVKNGRWQRNMYSFPKSTANNLKWLSPELLEQDLHGYNEKSDIYSLGMTICELANGIVPFCDVPATLMLTEKVRGSAPHILDCSTFPSVTMDIELNENVVDDRASSNSLNAEKRIQHMSARKFSESFHAITELCLQRNPSDRPTMSQLLAHPFFKQCRKTDEMLINILKSITPISSRHIESIGDITISTERLAELDLKTYHWDF